MKYVLALTLFLTACATPKVEPSLPVTIKKQEVIVVSETLLARCESFPKFEQREYKEGELVDILDRWIKSHNSCSVKQSELAALIRKAFNLPDVKIQSSK